MNKEEIKEYLNRVDKLLDKLKGEDKETLSWLIYGYNQCAKLLNEAQKENEKYKEVIDRKKYLLKEQGAELKELYSEIDKLQGGIDKAIEYLEEPNRDSFDYSKAKLLDILNEVSE